MIKIHIFAHFYSNVIEYICHRKIIKEIKLHNYIIKLN